MGILGIPSNKTPTKRQGSLGKDLTKR